MLDRYIDGRLGLIFDTTSANAGKIKSYLNMLNHLGYESKMIYVSTSLDNAKKRNNMRPRKLPDAIVEKDWKQFTKEYCNHEKMFGKNFVQVTNDDDLSSLQKKTNSLFSKLMTWSTSFPMNKKSSLWKQRQLLTKKYK